MTQYVFDNAMTAHVWAQGNQSHGRSNNGNLYFEGKKLFSYGSHFIVGYLLENGDGLLNSDSYSVSTSRHQSYAHNALRGSGYFVPDLTTVIGLIESRDEKRKVKLIRQFIADNHSSISDESAQKLLSLAGGKGNVSTSVAKIKREAEKRSQLIQKRAEIQNAKNHAAIIRKLASATDQQIDLLIRNATVYRKNLHISDHDTQPLPVTYNEWFAWHERLKKITTAIRRHRRDGKARVTALQWKKAGEVLGHVLVAMEYAENRFAHAARRDKLKTAIAEYRKAARANFKKERWTYNGEPGTAKALSHWANSAEKVRRLAFGDTNELAKLIKQIRDTETKIKEREHIAREKAEAEKKTKWLAGDKSVRWYGRTLNGGYYIRANDIERDDRGEITGGTLETTGYATVPLVHAIKAFRFVKLVRTRNREWSRNGRSLRIGHFQADKIAANGDMKAGCHFIEFSEMARLAREIGIAGILPDDSALS